MLNRANVLFLFFKSFLLVLKKIFILEGRLRTGYSSIRFEIFLLSRSATHDETHSATREVIIINLFNVEINITIKIIYGKKEKRTLAVTKIRLINSCQPKNKTVKNIFLKKAALLYEDN